MSETTRYLAQHVAREFHEQCHGMTGRKWLTLAPVGNRHPMLWFARAGFAIAALLTLFNGIAFANERGAFETIAVAEVRLFRFMIATGEMIPEPDTTLREIGDGTIETKTFGFPLDRHFLIGIRFAIDPGQSSGYRLPDTEVVRVRVGGSERHIWRNFYLHGRTYDTKGVLSSTASAWKFVTLDLVCDPLDVDVMHRGQRLKRVRVNGRCPE